VYTHVTSFDGSELASRFFPMIVAFAFFVVVIVAGVDLVVTDGKTRCRRRRETF
jgi:hypothetical protein